MAQAAGQAIQLLLVAVGHMAQAAGQAIIPVRGGGIFHFNLTQGP